MNKFEITVNQALNLAVQAYHQNDGKYVKYDFGDKKANKTIMLELLQSDSPYNADYEKTVEDILDSQKSLIFSVLSGTANSYQTSMYSVLGKEIITQKEIGFIAPLPKMFFEDQRRQQFSSTLSTSQHLSQIGKTIEGSAFLYDSRYIESRGFFVYTFNMDGNLLTHFSSKSPDEFNLIVGKTYKIKAKIKKHGVSKFYGDVLDNVVNYLKVSE